MRVIYLSSNHPIFLEDAELILIINIRINLFQFIRETQKNNLSRFSNRG